jgi:enoyl-CoA hydratase
MKELVTYQLRDGVATIAMDDGKVNVMSNAMQSAVMSALDKAVADKAIVVLTGRPGVFSAGFDLAVLTAGNSDAHAMLKGGFELALRIYSLAVPVVVACSGHALAMGAFLLLAADYRVGAAGAFKIGANEVAIGLTMPHFALELLRQRLSPSYFSRAAITAEIFAPDQAVAAGFLDQVVGADEVLVDAQKKAVQFANLNMAAYVATKLRAREQIVSTMRKAIEIDDASFRSRR